LSLTARKVEALETELGVDAVVERLNEIPDPSLTAGVLDLGLRCDVLESKGEVEPDLVGTDVKEKRSDTVDLGRAECGQRRTVPA
jgi:metal-sulfur cluster biosynthetic enzyme